MATARRELRATTLGLAILMAFPWQLAFSAIERCAFEGFPNGSPRQDITAQPLHWRCGPATAPIPMDGLALVLVAGEAEEEGNDVCPLDLTVSLSLLERAALLSESKAAPLTIQAGPAPFPPFVRVRLRC